MLNVNAKKTTYLEQSFGDGDNFFTLKDSAKLEGKLKLLKQSDFAFDLEEDDYNRIMRDIENTESYDAELVISSGLVGICLLYVRYSQEYCATFLELRDYSSLSSEEEIKSIIDNAVQHKIKALKEELLVLESND